MFQDVSRIYFLKDSVTYLEIKYRVYFYIIE